MLDVHELWSVLCAGFKEYYVLLMSGAGCWEELCEKNESEKAVSF